MFFNNCIDKNQNKVHFEEGSSEPLTFEGFVASLKKLQHNFPKMRGGGSKAVWNFSENSSVLEGVSVPRVEILLKKDKTTKKCTAMCLGVVLVWTACLLWGWVWVQFLRKLHTLHKTSWKDVSWKYTLMQPWTNRNSCLLMKWLGWLWGVEGGVVCMDC